MKLSGDFGLLSVFTFILGIPGFSLFVSMTIGCWVAEEIWDLAKRWVVMR